MSNTPTQPLASPPPASSGAGTGKPSPLLITVIAVAGVLLLTVVALVFLLLGRGLGSDNASGQESLSPSPTASESASPSASPAEEEEPEEEPVDTSTRFTSFTAPTTVFCDPDAEEKPKIQVSWSSANAVSAWFAPDDGDASDGTGYSIPLSGNQDDITENDHEFPCNHRGEQDYTLTLVGPNGEKVHEHWTVVDPDFGN